MMVQVMPASCLAEGMLKIQQVTIATSTTDVDRKLSPTTNSAAEPMTLPI
jgi:plastocyanin domain-containing protein